MIYQFQVNQNLLKKGDIMYTLLDPWSYDSNDSIGSVIRSIANAFVIGSSEGILIYMGMRLFSS